MTVVMRAQYTKGNEVRYISHLDLQRIFGRTLRRAKLPVAYSQGFNPHPKLSFGSALSVGTTSESEFIDIEMAELIEADEFVERMNQILPIGFKIIEAVAYSTAEEGVKLSTLMSVINAAEYEISFYDDTQLTDMEAVIDKINQSESWSVTRSNKKKERILDIKPFVYSIEAKEADNNQLIVTAIVQAGSQANVRPTEIVEVLQVYGDAPTKSYNIHRKKLGIMDKGRIIKPFST